MIEGCFPEDEGNLCTSRLFSFLSLEFSSLLNLLRAHFLQEAFWDWLYLALITPTGLCISFGASFIKYL